ncbi:hypothetical protein MTR67_034423 [Solanum verrucosum]|uniref:Tf2-1-like SH3-like domain-containing protein n=1 Tax=Solanum verrucosum TaxID=315347 RepID=A0AAF0U890_SOLVR|nr:hypothetical protein MTR67_034423 [Solanum verrucosum]
MAEMVVKECHTTIHINDMDISCLLVHAQQIKEKKLKERSRETKKSRSGDSDFSHSRSDGHGLPKFQQRFSSQVSPMLRLLNSTKIRCLILRLNEEMEVEFHYYKIRDCPSVLKNERDNHRRAQPYPSSGSSGTEKQNRFWRKHDSVWVIVDRIMKSAQFIHVDVSYSAEDYENLYLREMGFGTLVKLSMAFHPQINGKVGCTIQTLEDILRACVIYFRGPELENEAMEKVWLIIERFKTTQRQQKSYVDVISRDLELNVHDWVYLKILPMKGLMTFGKKGKLSPCFVGLYQVLRCIGKVVYELDFPNNLASVYPVIHVSLLKKCVVHLTSIVP